MDVSSYELAKRAIAGQTAVHSIGPISDRVVENAELLLGVRFPPSYKQFLREFGCLGLIGEEIYGIVNENLATGPVPNGIWLTLDQRAKFSLPKQFVIIQSTGFGGWYAIDTSKENHIGECPVVLVDVFQQAIETVALDFGEHLLNCAKQAME